MQLDEEAEVRISFYVPRKLDPNEREKYRWTYDQWTPCTQSCAGGEFNICQTRWRSKVFRKNVPFVSGLKMALKSRQGCATQRCARRTFHRVVMPHPAPQSKFRVKNIFFSFQVGSGQVVRMLSNLWWWLSSARALLFLHWPSSKLLKVPS